jgi:ubiquinone biosynthesis protein COQ4
VASVGTPGRGGSGPSALGRIGKFLLAAKYFWIMLFSKSRQTQAGDRFLMITEGPIFERSLDEFSASPAGVALLETRPDTFALLRDRAGLESLPAGSIGRCYLEFMTSFGLDEDIYVAAAKAAGASYVGDPPRAWFRTRVNAMHDVRHLISGYGPDFRGEMCLLSFRFGQLGHCGCLVLAALSALGDAIRLRPGAFSAAMEAYRRGRRSKRLDLFPWEHELGASLAHHRARLGLAPPRHYPMCVAPQAWSTLRPAHVSLEAAPARA